MRNKELLIKDLKVINSCTGEELEVAAEYLLTKHPQRVDNYLHDENNRGLAYHICGYDGKCQQKFIKDIKFTHNVNVF
ncbi:hypothetical protein [Staphylococcus haemolyticus]|uniref:hypothetical protein n=1 Tax=Staphylococcus haemolyticus TaxID=1283 RepID=UPI000BA63189|nr:hypothetical protein [Staphylococcus haemolyticus]PAK69866.1 hypothetical protein B8W97_07835 [Staphylococcus haemolyticus]